MEVVPTGLDGVPDILLLSPKYQMRWVAACCVVAQVTDYHVVGYFALEKLVGEAVSLDQPAPSTTNSDAPVTGALSAPLELPTVIGASDVETIQEL